MPKHHAPRTPLILASGDGERPDADRVGLLSLNRPDHAKWRVLAVLSETGDLRGAAVNLYAVLEQLDSQGLNVIAAFALPWTGLGLAIADRLHRAGGSARNAGCNTGS